MNFTTYKSTTTAPQAIGVVRVAARGLYRSRLPQMAAALAYRTIFGTIPVLIVAMVIVQYFADDDDITRWVEKVLDHTGISQIVIPADPAVVGAEIDTSAELSESAGGLGDAEQPADPGADPASPSPSQPDQGESTDPTTPASTVPDDPVSDGSDSEQDSSGELTQADDSQAQRLNEWIVQIVQGVRGIKFRAIGFVGVLLLIYAAISMLVEIERTFNQVYRAPRGRSWPRRIITYWTVLTLGTILLCATFIVGGRFREWFTTFAASQQFDISNPLTITLATFAVTVLISTVLLWLVYITMPTTRVHLRAALAGALVAAILWEAGKWGFTNYLAISGTSKYATLYGGIALIPLFLLWVYLTWLVVLFGLQVSYGIQMLGSWREIVSESQEDDEQMVDPLVVIPLMTHIASRFGSGESTDTTGLAKHIGLHETLVGGLLERLVEASLLNRVDSNGDTAAFALARPADEIALRDLLQIGEQLTVRTDESGCGALLGRLREARLDEIGDQPLSTLIASDKLGGSQESD